MTDPLDWIDEQPSDEVQDELLKRCAENIIRMGSLPNTNEKEILQ